MTMIYSSLFQLDLFEKEIFRNITQVYFYQHVDKFQSDKRTSGVVCSLVLLEKKSAESWPYFFYVYAYIWTFIFDDSFFKYCEKKEVVFNDLFIRLKRKFVVNF